MFFFPKKNDVFSLTSRLAVETFYISCTVVVQLLCEGLLRPMDTTALGAVQVLQNTCKIHVASNFSASLRAAETHLHSGGGVALRFRLGWFNSIGPTPPATE